MTPNNDAHVMHVMDNTAWRTTCSTARIELVLNRLVPQDCSLRTEPHCQEDIPLLESKSQISRKLPLLELVLHILKQVYLQTELAPFKMIKKSPMSLAVSLQSSLGGQRVNM